MLFNSFAFILGFLPVVAGVFWLAAPWTSRRVRIIWLVAASLFFYGWWNPKYVLLLTASIVFNYGIGYALSAMASGSSSAAARKLVLIFGIATDLAVLGYFKYANFLLDSFNAVAGTHFDVVQIVLPLGISFFTFTQITFLVDTYRLEADEPDFARYALFVTYFPHLIAGPVLHHKEMMPQFATVRSRVNYTDLAVGLTMFSFGLFKKVVLADSIAPYATPVFDAASAGVRLTMFEAWGGVLAYSFQIYYDFSGYSDMAIGLSRLFGVRLPINFYSPYRARNIIEFWRRWHITLSRFLRDYLYIPLGGNRQGKGRRYVNLMTTMFLGGLWHGANWTFVIWGGLHGLYLAANHVWAERTEKVGTRARQPALSLRAMGSVAATFFAVAVAWVFFRAETFTAAARMLRAMFGGNGLSLPQALAGPLAWAAPLGVRFDGTFQNGLAPWATGCALLAALAAITWLSPNTQQIMTAFRPTLDGARFGRGDTWSKRFRWAPTPMNAAIHVALILVSVMTMTVGRYSEFLYFQF